jgi:CPA2 family monovalent cation:H+ antiporter-2
VGIITGKFIIVFLVASAMRLPLRVGVLTAAALAQVGEFSFVLLQATNGTGLLEEPLRGNLTVAIILSMLATPFGLALGPRLASGLGRLNPLTRVLKVRTTEEMHEKQPQRHHVIIAGYGLTGRILARTLTQIGARFIIVDINTENVRQAVRLGEPACFGDVTSSEVLEHLGVGEATDLVIAINDLDATARATRCARRAAPDLRITVRTTYDADVDRLSEAGATCVVSAEDAAAGVITERMISNFERGPDGHGDPNSRTDGTTTQGGER